MEDDFWFAHRRVWVYILLLNRLYNFAPQAANQPVVIICIALIAYMLYQCPFCGKYPEEEDDVRMFDSKQCSNCKERLK